jgi:hypothetical protein
MMMIIRVNCFEIVGTMIVCLSVSRGVYCTYCQCIRSSSGMCRRWQHSSNKNEGVVFVIGFISSMNGIIGAGGLLARAGDFRKSFGLSLGRTLDEAEPYVPNLKFEDEI